MAKREGLQINTKRRGFFRLICDCFATIEPKKPIFAVRGGFSLCSIKQPSSTFGHSIYYLLTFHFFSIYFIKNKNKNRTKPNFFRLMMYLLI